MKFFVCSPLFLLMLLATALTAAGGSAVLQLEIFPIETCLVGSRLLATSILLSLLFGDCHPSIWPKPLMFLLRFEMHDKAGMLTEMHTNRYMFVKKRKLSDCNFLFGKIHTFRFPFMWRDEMLTTCDAFSFQWKKKMMFSVKVYQWHMANGSAYGNVFSWMTTNL